MPGPDRQRPGSLHGEAAETISGAIRNSGLLSPGDRGVVLVSGGADSVALLFGLADLLGPGNLLALHVNYGLRAEAEEDERLVRKICHQLGVKLKVHRAGNPVGNLQAWAREIRLGEAEKLRQREQMDWIAVGHNRSDQAETFLYRLASSPGTRSLLAMPPRSGRVIRPLLALESGLIRRLLDQVTRYVIDSSNLEGDFARNRIRHELLRDLEEIDPRAELNIVRTRAELVEDESLIVALAETAIERGTPQPDLGLEGEALAGQHPAVRRRMLRMIAERALGRPVAVNRGLSEEVLRLAAEPEGGMLDLGGGDRFRVEAGRVRAIPGDTGEEEVPAPVELAVKAGSIAFGRWLVTADEIDEATARRGFGDPWRAFLDPGALLSTFPGGHRGEGEPLLEIRAWRDGDRIEPLGMTGSKSLQDVFSDALIPASRRRNWPVLLVAGRPIWVPGLVRSRHHLIGGPEQPVLRLHALPPFSI